jgi:hypothetical protein
MRLRFLRWLWSSMLVVKAHRGQRANRRFHLDPKRHLAGDPAYSAKLDRYLWYIWWTNAGCSKLVIVAKFDELRSLGNVAGSLASGRPYAQDVCYGERKPQ